MNRVSNDVDVDALHAQSRGTHEELLVQFADRAHIVLLLVVPEENQDCSIKIKRKPHQHGSNTMLIIAIGNEPDFRGAGDEQRTGVQIKVHHMPAK